MMKKYLRPLLLAVLVITAGAMSYNAIKSIAAPAVPEEPLPTGLSVSQTESAEYWLRDCDGLIGVFRGDSSRPYSMTDIKTETLNDTDRRLVAAGIPAEDRETLVRLLEDLGS